MQGQQRRAWPAAAERAPAGRGHAQRQPGRHPGEQHLRDRGPHPGIRHGRDIGPPARVWAWVRGRVPDGARDRPPGHLGHWTPSWGTCRGRGRGRRPRAYSRTPCQRMRPLTAAVEAGCRTAERSRPAAVAGRRLAAHAGRECAAVRAVQGDGHREPFTRLRQGHPVPAIDREERGDVELLGRVGPAGLVGVQQVTVALPVGVVHLGHHALQRSGRPVAPVHGQRVEHVAEHARVREHRDPAPGQVDAARSQEPVQVRPDGVPRVTQVVGRPEVGQQPQPPGQAGQVVDVGQPLVGAVAEAVPQWRGADVPDPAFVEERRGRHRAGHHQRPPSETAAARPDRQPSSWKPQPW